MISSWQKIPLALLLLVLAGIATTVVLAADEELYSAKYDDVDVEEILSNPRLRNQYLKCYLGTGPCRTPDAVFLKEKFPEALVTKCRRCTEKQKHFFSRITIWYTEHEPETWRKVVEKTLKDVQNKD